MHSRTWPTEPGGPSSSSEATVCTESTTRRPGRSSRARSVIRPTPVSATTRIASPTAPLVMPETSRPEAHLAGRLLAGRVQHGAPRRGDTGRDLEQERRLADPGLSAEQDDGARDQAAAQHAVQLRDPHRAADLGVRVARMAQRDGRDRRDASCTSSRGPGPGLVADDGLDERVPLAAGPALALPAQHGRATGLADVPALGSGHAGARAADQASTGVFAGSAVIERPLPSGSRSIEITSPWLYRPSSRCSASGSSIRFWIVRRSGRAP